VESRRTSACWNAIEFLAPWKASSSFSFAAVRDVNDVFNAAKSLFRLGFLSARYPRYFQQDFGRSIGHLMPMHAGAEQRSIFRPKKLHSRIKSIGVA